MPNGLIEEAFADRPAVRQQITQYIASKPKSTALFEDIAKYVKELRSSVAAPGQREDEPAIKKRKLNGVGGDDVANDTGASNILTGTWSTSSIDVSFSVPRRKKLSLQISPSKTQGIRALNPSSKIPEFGIPWSSVEQVLRLPVPEKAQASHNFCVFPKGGDGYSGDGSTSSYETMVWGTAATKKKNEEDKPSETETVLAMLKGAKVKVVEPDEREFASAIPHPMRKSEKQYHVKAFRGSKEGYLYFLPTGIAFVFKKPLLFFSFAAVDSISYTSVLQRTFNLNISARSASIAGATTEIEFSMIDQADFAGIDAYIKRHGLNDASMAEARRAKKYNVNKEADGDEAGGDLERAQMEANGIAPEDDDEEDDDNFDPGSEGESEGEGSSSDEGDGNDGGDGNDRMETDIVHDELGSEAEDVEQDE